MRVDMTGSNAPMMRPKVCPVPIVEMLAERDGVSKTMVIRMLSNSHNAVHPGEWPERGLRW